MTGAKTLCAQVFCQHEDLHGDDLHEFGGLEFPQINYGRCNTKPYRYFYGCGFRHLVGDSLLKMDLKDKTFKVRARFHGYDQVGIEVGAKKINHLSNLQDFQYRSTENG